MPLGKLNRDIAYFQDLRDNNSLVNAVDFDDQFNQLVSFINDQMIPIVDTLAGGIVPGIEGSPNTFLRNIGDGNTDFVAINNAAIPDFVLEFSKLVKSTNSCAILATGNDGGFIEVATNVSNQILISVAGSSPVWRKIQTGDIEDRTVTALKIALGTITSTNMIPGTLINNLGDNSILGQNFGNLQVTNSKITRNTLEIRNLGVIWSDAINNAVFIGKINKRYIALRTLSGEKIKNPVRTELFNLGKCIISGKIAPQDINDEKLESWDILPGQNAKGHFLSNSLNPNFKLTSQELALNYFRRGMFEATAEQAFIAKGCDA